LAGITGREQYKSAEREMPGEPRHHREEFSVTSAGPTVFHTSTEIRSIINVTFQNGSYRSKGIAHSISKKRPQFPIPEPTM